ncbi:MAG: hypothetical protein LBT74_08570 [Acidobacteriota bacterium]|jgi:pimeloyl-ACP methyl ester carboxylesterase|nr:hypothetical protein [Acidobacteriota bacterium]
MAQYYNQTEESQAKRWMRTVLPGVAIIIVGVLALFSILVYKVSYPGVAVEGVDPSQYILPYQSLEIPSSDGQAIHAWWIPGRKGSPGVILATGYGMSRTDALSLAAALYQESFSLLVFDQRGSGAAPRGLSTLGLKEATDMTDAIRFLKEQPDVDPNRIGVWGVDVSAFAALKASGGFPEVQAIVADSPFLDVREFLNYRLSEDFGIENRFMRFVCDRMFQLFYVFGSESGDYVLSGDTLADRSVLFIEGQDRPKMEALTNAAYEKVAARKELYIVAMPRVHAMSGEALKEYDRQVTMFFRSTLPVDDGLAGK